jgi:hypothetical protein
MRAERKAWAERSSRTGAPETLKPKTSHAQGEVRGVLGCADPENHYESRGREGEEGHR